MKFNASYRIDGIDFTTPKLDSYGFNIGVRNWKGKYDKDHFLIKTVGEAYEEDNFSFAHAPLVVDEVFDHGKFSYPNGIRVLDMPIKLPKTNEYRVPKELNQFDEVISKIVSFEHLINKNADLYYAYITVDQGNISAGKTQRRPGCHCNGIQTGVYRRPVSRSYIVYSKIPDVFYGQSFDVSDLDDNKDNFFLSFDDQSIELASITFDPYSILLTNAYTVQRAATADKTCYRTFLRITFDLVQYNRLGNTHNPMLDYSWNMVSKTKQSGLNHKKLDK